MKPADDVLEVHHYAKLRLPDELHVQRQAMAASPGDRHGRLRHLLDRGLQSHRNVTVVAVLDTRQRHSGHARKLLQQRTKQSPKSAAKFGSN